MMTIKALSYIDLIILGCISIWCAVVGLKNRQYLFGKRLNDETIIRQPRLFCYAAVFVLAIFIFGLAFCVFDIRNYESRKYFETIILAQLMLLPIGFGVYLLFLSLNWKICLYEDYFSHTNTLGITRPYRYDEIQEKALKATYRYYWKGRYKFPISFLQPNCNKLSIAIEAYVKKRIYRLPVKQRNVDFETLRQEELAWIEKASSVDRALYDELIEKLKTSDVGIFIADYISEVQDKSIFPIFEGTLLSWEDKKMQALVAYIIGSKENKNAYGIILKAYLSLSWEDKKRYASLYDNAIRNTITREPLLLDKEWLADWHSAFNLPNTMKKIAKGNLPGINEIWVGILRQKNTYDREWYDFEEAKATLLPLVRR